MEGFKVASPLRKGGSPSPSRKDKKKQQEEEKLILLQNRNDPMAQSFNKDDPKSELSLKIDNFSKTPSPSSTSPSTLPEISPTVGGQPQKQQHKNIWRDTSYDFRNDAVPIPPRKSTQSHPSNNSDDDDGDSSDSKEFDFPKQNKDEQQEQDLENQCMSPVSESPNNEYGKITPRAANVGNRVSFRECELVQRHRSSNFGAHNNNNNYGVGVSGGGDDEQVVIQCSASASFNRQQKSGILRTKTKSRLMDPPEDVGVGVQGPDKRSGRTMRSGFLGRSEEIEEDDPFLDDDIPEEYKKVKFSCFSIIQWVTLVLVIAAAVCSVAIPVLKGKTIWGMQIWKWAVMVLVLICGGLVSGWLIRIVVFFIERNFLLRKRVLYFVYGLRSSVQKFLWLGWVLLAWNLILDKKVEKETNSKVLPYVTKILICFMVATLMWLVKTLLLKVLAMNFHVSAFFDRIQDALFNQYVIETLSAPPYIELQRIQDEEDRVMTEVQKLQSAGIHVPADLRANCLPNNGKTSGSGRSTASGLQRSPFIGKSPKSSIFGKSPKFSRAPSKREEEQEDGGISIDHLHRLNQKNVSAWNMKRLMNTVRKGVLSTLDEQLDSGIEDDSALQIRSEKEAKAAAKRIFTNVARPGSKHIHLEDLMRFLREDEAHRAMQLLEGSVDRSGNSKGISKRALKNWVLLTSWSL